MNQATTVRITHYSDLLCVWAYIAEVRCTELETRLPGQVSFDYRFVQVFGSVRLKLEAAWKDRGGIGGYADHVAGVVADFDHVSVHPETWRSVVPESSVPGHLALAALRHLEETGEVERGSYRDFAWQLRRAFFAEAVDIARRSELMDQAARAGLPVARIEDLLDRGVAHAIMARDLDEARDGAIRASPTMVLNEGRQRLTGNVGYRVLEANVRELLERPTVGHSWC
jgi:predicted DsbA family dithiol-disulfide isomerase